MKRILVTTDLHRDSECACSEAAKLASELGATVILATVVKTAYGPEGAGLLDTAQARALSSKNESLSKASAELGYLQKQYFESVPCESIIAETGEPIAKAIVRVAREKKVDLIVMCTHGRRGVSRAVLGSTAEEVVRRSKLPVMLIPLEGTTVDEE